MICSSIFLEGTQFTSPNLCSPLVRFFSETKHLRLFLLSRATSSLFFIRMGVPTPSFVNAGDGLFTHPIGEFVRGLVRTNLSDMVWFLKRNGWGKSGSQQKTWLTSRLVGNTMVDTPQKFKIAPENKPSQKESSLPTTTLGAM